MTWEWTRHAVRQLKERSLLEEEVKDTLAHPDKVVSGTGNRIIYQKKYGDKLLRVITDERRIITAYKTCKITKYMEE